MACGGCSIIRRDRAWALEEGELVAIEEAEVAELQVRDDEEGHEGKRHEGRGKSRAEPFCFLVDGGIEIGDVPGVVGGHKAGYGEGEEEVAGAGGRGDGIDAGEAAFLAYDQVDGAADAFVVDADGHDIMTVMGNRRGDGAAAEAEIADKGFGDGRGLVAVDYDDLQDIFFGVGVQTAVAYRDVGDGEDQLTRNELAVERFDAMALFDVLLLAPFVEGIGEVACDAGLGVEVVN